MKNIRMLFPAAIAFLILGLGAHFVLAYQAPLTPDSNPGFRTPTVLDSWPTLRHDNGHTGYVSNVGSFRPPLAHLDTIELQDLNGENWQIFNLVTSPDRIFAMGQHVIWGVNKEDPSIQWRNDDCVPNDKDICFNTFLAYSTDRLMVIRQNYFLSTFDFGNELIILNAATGQEVWSRSLGDTGPEIALEGDSILLLTEENGTGKLTRLDLSGRQDFMVTADTSGEPGGRAVVAGGLFIYPNGNRILAYRTDNGQPAWVYTPVPHTDPHGYDLVATTDAVIISQDDRVIKLDIANGTFIWETNVKPGSCTSQLGPNGAATNETIVAVTSVCDKEIVGLDYTTGGEQWRNPLGQIYSASDIAMTSDSLYAGAVITSTGPLTRTYFGIYALDPGTGSELQRLHLDIAEASTVLAISDGLLLTASSSGTRLMQRFERTPADLNASLSQASLPACGAAVGGMVTFNFQVTNNGPGTTDQTRADLTLPDGTPSLTTDTGICTTSPTAFCDLGALSAGQQALITATVVLSNAGSFSTGISLSGNVRDPDTSNNSSITTLAVGSAAPGTLDLQVTDIEITQGIQNLANDVPLVNGKTTIVRVYAKTNGGQVQNVSAVLRGERLLTGDDLGTLTPIQSTACLTLNGDTPNRDQLSGSFVFQLLPEETWLNGGVIFTAEVNPEGAIPDTNTANDTLTITRGFTRLPHICLKTYPVRTAGTLPGGGLTDNLFPDYMAIAEDTGNILSRALTMLPVREIKVYPKSHLIEEWEPFNGGWGPYEMLKSDDNRGDVLDTLWWLDLFSGDPDLCDADSSRTHYVGLIDSGTTNDVGSAGLGKVGGDELTFFLNTGRNGPQAFDDPHGGLTLAHELGHNYDRNHVNCGKPKDPDPNYPKDRNRCNIAPIDPRGYYGLEFRDPTNLTVITPTMAGDVMSYATDVWTSEYTWEAIQDELCDARGCTFPSVSRKEGGSLTHPAAASVLTDDVLIVQGQISPTLSLGEIYLLPVSQVPKANKLWDEQVASRPVTSTYVLQLVGGMTVLSSEPFTPTHSADQGIERESFGLVLPWDPSTTRVELVQSGTVVTSVDVSPSPPTVTAILPNGGETFTDTLPISWIATDADGDDLRYTVLYSPDEGANWQALATGVETTTLVIDSTLLPGTPGQGWVKVIASDGLHTASRQSEAGFTLPDRAPYAFIYFPDDGGEYPSGSIFTLQGAVYDVEDDYLDPALLTWSLSGQGVLGTGESLLLSGLADGEYTLTLSGTDSSAQVESKTINFRIGTGSKVFLPLLTH